MSKLCLILALLLLHAPLAVAEQVRYVDDTLYLGLYRQAGGLGGQFLSLPSGTKLTLLESQSGYSQVRTEKGAEGWVKSKYLVAEPPASIRIIPLEKAAERAAALALQVEATQAENGKLKARVAQLQNDMQRVQAETESSREQAIVDLVPVEEIITRQQLEALKKATRDAVIALQGVTEMSRLNSDNSERESPPPNDSAYAAGAPSIADFFAKEQSSLRTWRSIAGEFTRMTSFHLVLFAVIFVAGIALGVVVLDRRIRKQHGGYRIW